MLGHNFKTRPASLALAFLLAMLTTTVARADSFTLAWDANPEPAVVGYYVYVGTSPGVYTTTVDVGDVTTYTYTSALPGTTYYLTVAAYLPGPVLGPKATPLVTTTDGGPNLSNPGNRSNNRGTALTLTLSATDPNNDPITFGALGLPNGLSLNPTTGVISGTPTTAGTFNVSVTASDPSANVTTQQFTWTIVATDAAAPTIAITAPTTGATYTTSSAFVTLTGTAADDVGVTSVTWANNTGGSGTAAGTTSWSIVIPVVTGSNVLTVTARDAANKSTTATLTVSSTLPLQLTALTANRTAPQVTGTAVTFTTTASGGTTPYQYKWRVFDGATWTVTQIWSASASFTWTPTVADADYRVEVWARSAGSTTDAAENANASRNMAFAISAPVTPLALTALTANRTAPQVAGTATTFTTTASNGTAPYQYKWRVFDGTTWTVAQTWNASASFTWTPTVADADYRVEVWARSAGSTTDAAENANASRNMAFAITAPVTPLALTALTANRTAPQVTGTAITFTTTASNGTAPYQYKWRVFDGSTWTVAQTWNTSASFTWTPTVADADYRVEVWARSAGSTTDAAENANASRNLAFAITSPGPSVFAPVRIDAGGPGFVDTSGDTWIADAFFTGGNVGFGTAATAQIANTLDDGLYRSDRYGSFSYAVPVPTGTYTVTLKFAELYWGVRSNTTSVGRRAFNVTIEGQQILSSFDLAAAVGVLAALDRTYTVAVADGTLNVTFAAVLDHSTLAALEIEAGAAPPQSTPIAATLTANRPTPQVTGTAITFTAAASGGTAPYQYKWRVFDGSTWSTAQNWNTSASFAWTPTVANSAYQVEVWARNAGSTTDAPDNANASRNLAYAITTPITPLSLTALTSDKAAPQVAGTAITFATSASNGTAPYQYKWRVFDGVSWTVAQNWSSSASFTWTPTVADADYRVEVWARSAGNTTDAAENANASRNLAFAINPQVAPMALTSLTSDKASPQLTGTVVNFTTAVSGGTAPYQYKWRVFNGASWTVAQNWSTSRTFAWTPSVANSGYQVEVWARSAGNTTDAAENANASRNLAFAINAPIVPLALTALTSDKPAPQIAGTAITFSASGNNGTAPYQYKWRVFDGVSWTVARTWSSSASFTWTPTVADADYRVEVWARSAGNTTDAAENANASRNLAFAINPQVAPMALTSLTSDKASPQLTGTVVTFTTAVSGGTAPYQYKWRVFNGASWTVAQNWSTNRTFAWTPSVANSGYQVEVWARSAGNTTDAAENANASRNLAFAINAPTSTGPLELTAISTDKPAPQAAGTTVVFTAQAIGGTAPYQYRWWLFDGATWTALGTWSSSASLSWTPSTPDSEYRVGVWVRSAGSTQDMSDNDDSNGSIMFPIEGVRVSQPLAVATVTTDRPSPQEVGTRIVFTAAATGGTGPYAYKWRVFNGTTWTVAQNWSAAASFAWTPTAPGSTYQVSVWARSAGSTTDAPENAASSVVRNFAVTLTPASPLRLLGLTTNRPAPQAAGTPIAVTATVAGGVPALQYKWWLFDGQSWTMLSGWSASPTFMWTPSGAGDYRIGVWVRSSTNLLDMSDNDASNGSISFAVQ